MGRKSDKDLGKELGIMMQLQNAADKERKNTDRAVMLFIGIIIFLCAIGAFLHMLGAF